MTKITTFEELPEELGSGGSFINYYALFYLVGGRVGGDQLEYTRTRTKYAITLPGDAIEADYDLQVVFEGTGFKYKAGVPIAGTATGISVRGLEFGDAIDFMRIDDFSLPLKQLHTAFSKDFEFDRYGESIIKAFSIFGRISFEGSTIDDLGFGANSKDLLRGGEGDDNLFGNDNNDILRGEAGNDNLNGGFGNDKLSGDAGDDDLAGGGDNDSLRGGDGADSLNGGSGNDTLFGEDGDDTLEGSQGNDVMFGGTGNDTFDGGSGNDTANYGKEAASLDADLVAGAATVGLETDSLDSVESIVGTRFNDTVLGDASDNRFLGQAGADELTGADGNDLLQGAAGDDMLKGGKGNDTLIGGEGIDLADYGDATKGVKVDLMILDPQNTGGSGKDKLAGIEILIGGAFADTLGGNEAANILSGGAGDDLVMGRDGNDTLAGDAGADTIFSGGGADRISGGSEADHFVFRFQPGVFDGGDIIGDFAAGVDKIDLTGTDANTGLAGIQGFTYIGNTAFSGAPGEVRWVHSGVVGTQIFGNTDGDTGPEFIITLSPGATLTAADFIL